MRFPILLKCIHSDDTSITPKHVYLQLKYDAFQGILVDLILNTKYHSGRCCSCHGSNHVILMISVDEESYSEVLARHGLFLGGLVQERLQICDTLGLAVGLHAYAK